MVDLAIDVEQGTAAGCRLDSERQLQRTPGNMQCIFRAFEAARKTVVGFLQQISAAALEDRIRVARGVMRKAPLRPFEIRRCHG